MSKATLARIAPGVTAQVLATKQKAAEEFLATILEVDTIESAEDFDTIKQLANEQAKKLDAWVSLRQSIVGPRKAEIQDVEKLFRPGAKVLEAGIDHMRGLLNSYETAKRQEEHEAQQALMQAASRGEDVTEQLNALAVDPSTQQARETWIWKLVDMNSVPRNFICLDSSALKIYLKKCAAQGTTPDVPGLKFEKQATVILSRK